jgi:hypothetical protein
MFTEGQIDPISHPHLGNRTAILLSVSRLGEYYEVPRITPNRVMSDRQKTYINRVFIVNLAS